MQTEDHVQCLQLKCTRSGELHAFAVWFCLQLCKNSIKESEEMNEQTTLQIDTYEDEDSCWQQAIYPVKGLYYL